ncbi:DUF4260 domain-containing protein [Limimaricola litoreus]|uniref:DUF4260 domain-containing protein n=1 Tax=Limimaricola litoreus TaxID=2955316 RepID=A0A9X2FXF7_9RHOB|nr:DUF4260 domain-containing protein [Limimaricola litoreus]MCP1170211.1 DUF4260 domain-containing protein [Limimaricola litoreus]
MDVIGWQRLEGMLVLLGTILYYPYIEADMPYWLFLLLFFAPDIGMLGYALGPRIGAVTYNLPHLYGFGTAVIGVGIVAELPFVTAMGALWMAHAGMDRILGYGLKSPEGFKITHLGPIEGADEP